mmetsp:Transcript_3905/g.15079  ORF Transcript_3905/g.15079 Transcript_3905/m.15079 type:complete len:202 (-) Transcript_3905:882-1487(-)
MSIDFDAARIFSAARSAIKPSPVLVRLVEASPPPPAARSKVSRSFVMTSSSASASVSLEPEDELLVELVCSPALTSLRRGCASATSAKSGRTRRNFSSHLADIFGRARRVMRHTASNRAEVEKFCVTAMVWSRFSTACHQPSGTNMISPGCWMTSMGGGNPWRFHSSVVVRGYILLNQVTDSPSRPIPRGLIVALSTERGG